MVIALKIAHFKTLFQFKIVLEIVIIILQTLSVWGRKMAQCAKWYEHDTNETILVIFKLGANKTGNPN